MTTGQPTPKTYRGKAQKEQLYRERKAAGLCVRCGKPAEAGKAQCPVCIGKQAAKRIRIRLTGLAAGLCTVCGGRRDRPGRKLCTTCNEIRATERTRRRTAGLCPCGRAVTSGKKCDPCNVLERERKAGFRTRGLCPCGRHQPAPGRRRCRTCLTYFRLFTADRLRVRRAAGLCLGCGKRPPRRGKKSCKPCGVGQVLYTRQWARNHPDRASATWAASRFRRQQRIAFSGGNFTAAEWLALKRTHGRRCLACGKVEPEIKLTVDHVIPISKGGSNDIANLQPLCLPCNLDKHVSDTDYRPKPR